MKNLSLMVRRFLKSEDGPTAVEYAVMLALIVFKHMRTPFAASLATRVGGAESEEQRVES
jgi:hypothetical protein